MLRRLAAGSRAVVGLDPSPDMLSLAKAHDGGARLVLGAVEAIPLDDRSLDAVVSLRLFGHLASEEKVAALREFSRVAIVGAVVCYAGDSPWLRFRRVRAGRNGPYWRPVSDSLLEKMASDAGLTAVGQLGILGRFPKRGRWYCVQTIHREPQRDPDADVPLDATAHDVGVSSGNHCGKLALKLSGSTVSLLASRHKEPPRLHGGDRPCVPGPSGFRSRPV